MVGVAPLTLIVTSSSGPGTASVLQLLATSQLPSPEIHWTWSSAALLEHLDVVDAEATRGRGGAETPGVRTTMLGHGERLGRRSCRNLGVAEGQQTPAVASPRTAYRSGRVLVSIPLNEKLYGFLPRRLHGTLGEPRDPASPAIPGITRDVVVVGAMPDSTIPWPRHSKPFIISAKMVRDPLTCRGLRFRNNLSRCRLIGAYLKEIRSRSAH